MSLLPTAIKVELYQPLTGVTPKLPILVAVAKALKSANSRAGLVPK